MELRYAPAGEQDIDRLLYFNKALIDQYEDISSIDYDKVLQWVCRKLHSHIREYTRVFADGELAAYYYFHETGGKMEIDDLYVLPGFQGRGIGSAIVRKCCGESAKPVFLYVFVKNTGAVALYQRLGFEILEHIGNTRYIMQRDG